MKKLLLLLLFISSSLLNAITIPGGIISGTWSANDNPYYIDGDITIETGTSLVIEPGVEIIFNESYAISVYGLLTANGTETETITVGLLETALGWQGFRFFNTNDNGQPMSSLSYCYIEKAAALGGDELNNGGAIYCDNSTISIDNCEFFQNYAAWDGGAICFKNGSDGSITNSQFTENSVGFYGASFISYYSNPYIFNCTFTANNAAFFAGAISFWEESDILVENCTILSNTAGAAGGIYGVSSNAVFKNCLFGDNSSSLGTSGAGGLVTCTSEFINCTIANNVAASGGGAFWMLDGSSTLTNCLIWGNTPDQLSLSDADVTINFSDIQGGWAGTENINLDPLFVNPSNQNYQLQDISPIFDLGTPDITGLDLPEIDLLGNPRVSDGDLDGNFIIDPGCYEYFTGFNLVLEAVTQDFNDIYLSWTIEGNTATITGFNLFMDGELLQTIDDNHTSNYLAEGFDTGNYEFYLTAVIDGEQSDPSNTVSVTTSLPTPTNLTAQSGVGSAILNWDAPARALLYYKIYREGSLLADNITETNYEDANLEDGMYSYTVSAVYTGDYESTQTDPAEVDVTASPSDEIPLHTALHDAYPNPFNPNTTISFAIAKQGHTKLDIYNSRGQKVSTLINTDLRPGIYTENWNGLDKDKKTVASGVYFIRLINNAQAITKSVTLMK